MKRIKEMRDGRIPLMIGIGADNKPDANANMKVLGDGSPLNKMVDDAFNQNPKKVHTSSQESLFPPIRGSQDQIDSLKKKDLNNTNDLELNKEIGRNSEVEMYSILKQENNKYETNDPMNQGSKSSSMPNVDEVDYNTNGKMIANSPSVLPDKKMNS